MIERVTLNRNLGVRTVVFSCVATSQIGPRPPRFEVSRSHTESHAPGRTPLRRGRYIHDTQQTQEMDCPQRD
jgi:hypothetical protein